MSKHKNGCQVWVDTMQFPHEKLSVYQKALDFFGGIQPHVSSWSKQHAFVDHLIRAAESILFNLVDGVRLHPTENKALTVDYAIGSVLECAACLDIAVLKGLLDSPVAYEKSADTLATRMVLHIAESNGRYASLSRQTFLDTANAAAAKLAVLLDMGVRRGILDKPEIESGKGLLVRVGQMTARKDYPAR